MKAIVMNCLNKDPKCRPSSAELLTSKFFAIIEESDNDAKLCLSEPIKKKSYNQKNDEEIQNIVLSTVEEIDDLIDISSPEKSDSWNNSFDKCENTIISEIFIKKSGEYWVEVKDMCYTATDTIQIGSKNKPRVELGNDTIICEGSVLILNASYPNASYRWGNDSAKSKKSITEEGSYRVRVSNNCGSVSDDIYVRTKNCECIVFVWWYYKKI